MIDLDVRLPTLFYQPQDYQDQGYLSKRAIFLARIATTFRKLRPDLTLHHGFRDGNKLQPSLFVRSGSAQASTTASREFHIQILLTVDNTLFPIMKSPSGHVSTDTTNHLCEQVSKSADRFYEDTARSECSMRQLALFLEHVAEMSPNFLQACVLGHLWLSQRGLNSSLAGGGFGSIEWSHILGLLLNSDMEADLPPSPGKLQPFQLFRLMLYFLAGQDLFRSPLITSKISTSANSLNEHPPGPVLFDSVRSFNVLFKMSLSSYYLLRHRAEASLAGLLDPVDNPLESLFTGRIDCPSFAYDLFLQISLKNSTTDEARIQDGAYRLLRWCNTLFQILRRGLGDRVHLIDVRPPLCPTWKVEKQKGSPSDPDMINVGFVFDGNNTNRVVDKGPPAADAASAAEFRQFWGSKVELRRFGDGSILNCAVWSATAPRSIVAQIIEHLIATHIESLASDTTMLYMEDPVSSVFEDDGNKGRAIQYQSGTTSLEDLEKTLRGLDGLPLNIAQVSLAQSQPMKETSKIPIISHRHNFTIVNIQFETSNRWPDDLKAIRMLKMACLLKIRDRLANSQSGITAHVGVAGTGLSLREASYLDLHYDGRHMFRLLVYEKIEEMMVRGFIATESGSTRRRQLVSQVVNGHWQNHELRQVHIQAMQSLSNHYESLPVAISLINKWRDSQFLSPHISDEVLELFIIRSFLHPGQFNVPGTAGKALLLTLLLLANWDWRSQPFIVDLSGEMTAAQVGAIRKEFEKQRRNDPAITRQAMFVASNLDPRGSAWTNLKPSKVVASRLTGLARAAVKLIVDHGNRLQPRRLFKHSVEDYDFVIYLEQGNDYVAASISLPVQEDSNSGTHSTKLMFVKELERLYSSHVTFFYNQERLECIGGIWTPSDQLKTWKVLANLAIVPQRKRMQDNGEIKINQAGTLNEIDRLGRGIIKSIRIRG